MVGVFMVTHFFKQRKKGHHRSNTDIRISLYIHVPTQKSEHVDVKQFQASLIRDYLFAFYSK